MNKAQEIQVTPAVAAGFDLTDLDNNTTNQNTFKVAVIEDEEGEPVSGFIIVGKNSNEYQGVVNKNRIENIQRASKRKKAIDATTEDGAKAVADAVSAQQRAEALGVIVGWFGFNRNGEPMPFDHSYTEKLLTKFPTWISKITQALENDANFLKV